MLKPKHNSNKIKSDEVFKEISSDTNWQDSVVYPRAMAVDPRQGFAVNTPKPGGCILSYFITKAKF